MAEPRFTFRPLTRSDAEAIASWRYPAPYDLYDLDSARSPDVIASLLHPAHHYYAVLSESGDLVAFRCFGPDAQVLGGDYAAAALDVGGGLRPDLTGRGLGRVVIRAALEYGMCKFQPKLFRATIASFNERALRTCERVGFIRQNEFMRASDQRRFTILTHQAE